VRYEAKDVPLSPPRAARKAAKARAICFNDLLVVWRIQMSPKSKWCSGSAGFINNAFALEEKALRNAPGQPTSATKRRSVNA